jgi:N-methylhydantoinase A
MTIATENIVGAIREITIAQGIDPREVAMVAGGGASGLNVVPIARELGCRRVLLPSTASALSACGALYSDFISEFSKARYAETRSLDRDSVNGALAEVEAAADEFLTRLTDVSLRDSQKDFMVEARYRAQVWELDVPIPDRIRTDDDVRKVEEAFHATHRRVFAVDEPGQYLECLLWKVRATAVLDKPRIGVRAVAGREERPVELAKAYFPDVGVGEVQVFHGTRLGTGMQIEGPAIIREPTTTIVLPTDSAATVTGLGNYLLEPFGRTDVTPRERRARRVAA